MSDKQTSGELVKRTKPCLTDNVGERGKDEGVEGGAGGDGDGVVVVVGGERVPASRVELAARSGYFRAMFLHGWTDGGLGEVELPELVDSASLRLLQTWPAVPQGEHAALGTAAVLALVRAAGYLEYREVHQVCRQLLTSRGRLERDCFEILAGRAIPSWGIEAPLHPLSKLHSSLQVFPCWALGSRRCGGRCWSSSYAPFPSWGWRR